MITEAIAYDQPLVRSGLRMILEGESDMQIVGECEDRFGQKGLVDLVALVGFYSLVSFVLNTFDVPGEDSLPDA
mgnify:CR=1 FL=1